MDNDYYTTTIKLEEDSSSIEELTNVSDKRTNLNNTKKSYKCSPMTTIEPQKTISEDAYNVGETCNGTIVKVEVDFENGHCFESVIEFEKYNVCDVQSTSHDLEELRTFVCDVCSMSFATKRRVARHITQSHSVQNLNGKRVIQNKFSHNDTSYKATKKIDGCNFESRIGTLYKRKKPFKCTVCLKSFALNSNLTKHQLVHTGEKPFRCTVCLTSFSQKSSLTKHQLVHTGEKPYRCTVCLMSFSEKCNLTKHERVHTGEKPYKCTVCLKSFVTKSQLAAHQRVHTGEKPYRCTVCLMSFSVKCNLTNHERVHTGEKPFRCTVCLTSFSQKSNLTKHQLVHTGEKPYRCTVCLMSFSVKGSLTKHERVHTGEKPYRCDFCLKTFSRATNLNKHKRLHTNG
ncbi:zinc finger protein 501-like [Adelges cooleyi]|uniref:zinc finger protein 501-like n=1 Tax=Adelges cooleyi TaxID=133065 RepID=UPI00217FC967|nr:zinc finger protein 501-like [Adelges cooleyi]XP_050439976.1 zinc finger protein 501-like [Adelges cooleyi]